MIQAIIVAGITGGILSAIYLFFRSVKRGLKDITEPAVLLHITASKMYDGTKKYNYFFLLTNSDTKLTFTGLKDRYYFNRGDYGDLKYDPNQKDHFAFNVTGSRPLPDEK